MAFGSWQVVQLFICWCGTSAHSKQENGDRTMQQVGWMGLAVAFFSVSAPALAAPAAEQAQELKLRPRLAARLGNEDGANRLDDISDAGELQRLDWRRASSELRNPESADHQRTRDREHQYQWMKPEPHQGEFTEPQVLS